jgi:hypothetical protein
MSARVVWNGLAELREALRNLPADLTAEAGNIVEGAGNAAAADARAGYAAKMKHPGELVEGVTVSRRDKGQFAASARVTNRSKLSHIFEHGSVARHYVSVHGVQHLTGRIPPMHVFIPAMIKRRRIMYQQLKALLQRHGLKVSGDG